MSRAFLVGGLLLLLLSSFCEAWVLPSQHRGRNRAARGGLLCAAPEGHGEFVTEITTVADFERITQQSEATDVIVIDFQRSNCKPCIRTAPEFKALAEKFHKKALFYNIDGDKDSGSLQVLKINNIRAVPTFQVWRRGKRVDFVQGAHVDELETIVMNEINIVESMGMRQPNEI